MRKEIFIHRGDGTLGLLDKALSQSRIPVGKYMLSLQRKEERNQRRIMKEKDKDLVIVVDRATSRPMTWVDHQFYFVHSVRPNSKRSPGYGYELETMTRKEARKLVEKHTEYRQNNNLSETRLDLMLLKP